MLPYFRKVIYSELMEMYIESASEQKVILFFNFHALRNSLNTG